MSAPEVNIRFLSKSDIESMITYRDVVEAVEGAFRSDGEGKMILPPKHKLPFEGRNILMPMTGYLQDMNAAGMKWMRFFPEQPEGIPTLWGQLLIMSDPHTGLPIAIMDATTITDMRTSGGHAVVAAKHLAKQSSKVLAVVGCGAQGKAGIRSFDENFTLAEIRVLDASEEGKKQCAALFDGKLRAKLTFPASKEELLEGADILLTCSGSQTPIILAEDIPKGCFVAGIASFYDLDPTLSHKADKWVLGHQGGDKLQIIDNPKFEGILSMDNVYATLGEIVTGKKPGRENDDEIISYSHMGMGSLDVAVGKKMLEKATEKGIGQMLKLI